MQQQAVQRRNLPDRLWIAANKAMSVLYILITLGWISYTIWYISNYVRRGEYWQAFFWMIGGLIPWYFYPVWLAPCGTYLLYDYCLKHWFPQNQAIFLAAAVLVAAEWAYLAFRSYPGATADAVAYVKNLFWGPRPTAAAPENPGAARRWPQGAPGSRDIGNKQRDSYFLYTEELRPRLTVVRKRSRFKDKAAFNKLVGVDEAVEALKDALELPMTHPELVKKYNITPPKGILLYGPPGTGKTSLARAAAEYFACYFISVKGSELAAGLVGQTEANVRELFREAYVERPSIIFFDEIDAIARRRDGIALNRPSDLALNVLLAEMDGFDEKRGIFVIGATNRVDVLDDALLRPGRFDRLIEIGLPNEEARRKLWLLYLEGRPVKGEIDLDLLTRASAGMSPAEIKAVVERAAINAAKGELRGEKPGIDAQALHAFMGRRLEVVNNGNQC